ncbi:hypothetical protein H6F58_07020 [Glutamicibacter sp. FBE19]|nr:hypothetical protein [Glutamicibacter sp. FBE19]
MPTNNAVKHTEINCIGRAPDNYEYLGTVADWFIVILTVILALVAGYAAFKAHQTLKQMRDEADEARESDRNMRTIDAFDKYTQALISLCDKFPNESNADFSAWHRSKAQYFPYLRISDQELAGVVKQIDDLIGGLFEAHTMANSIKKPKIFEYKHLGKEAQVVMDHLPDCALEITSVLAAWHLGDASDEFTAIEMEQLSLRLDELLSDPIGYSEEID